MSKTYNLDIFNETHKSLVTLIKTHNKLVEEEEERREAELKKQRDNSGVKSGN